METSESTSDEFEPIEKPRPVDLIAWFFPLSLFVLAAATVLLCSLFDKSVFELQRPRGWETTPFVLQAALVGTLALIVLSPAAVMVAAFLQLRNDNSDFILRLKHFGITLAGILVAVFGLAFFQPGIMDGFADGDWRKLFFANSSNSLSNGLSKSGTKVAGPPKSVPVVAHGFMADQTSAFRFIPEQTVFDAQPNSEATRQSRQNHIVNANIGPMWVIDEVAGPVVGSSHNHHGWLGWYKDGSPIIFSSGSNQFPVGPLTMQKFGADLGHNPIFGALVLAPVDSKSLEIWFMDPTKDKQPFSTNDYRALTSKAIDALWTQELVNNLLIVIERQNEYDEQTLDLLERIAIDGTQVVSLNDPFLTGHSGPLTKLSEIDDKARLKAAELVYKGSDSKRDQGLIDLWNAKVGRQTVVDSLRQRPMSERLYRLIRDHEVGLIHKSPDALPRDLSIGIQAVPLTRSLANSDFPRATQFAAEILSVSTRPEMHDEIFHSLSNRLKSKNEKIASAEECQELISAIEPQWLQVGVMSQMFKGTNISR